MQSENNKTNDELHELAVHYIGESNRLLFQELPNVITQIIKQETWKTRSDSFKNFGEYALNQTEGLGIANIMDGLQE